MKKETLILHTFTLDIPNIIYWEQRDQMTWVPRDQVTSDEEDIEKG